MEEELPWDVHLKHVEKPESKSPSPEVKPKPPSPEIERLQYIPIDKRERPEVRPEIIFICDPASEI